MKGRDVRMIKVILYVTCVTMSVLVATMAMYHQLSAWLSDTSLGLPPPNLVFHSPFQILIYNYPKVSIEMLNIWLVKTCEFTNCVITNDRSRSKLQSHAAIIFYITAAPMLPWKPPISPSRRNPNQVWIFNWLEPPQYHIFVHSMYKTKDWRTTVNWTMTYSYDADIFYPYGTIRRRHVPVVKNYREIFHRKTKMAAWVVSNCNTPNEREMYIRKLQQYGVKVDVFGRCAWNKIAADKMRNKINLKYKFYLAFENNNCKDYITEKFFKFFQDDVVLVVRGGGNYTKLLPNDSYINTADFRAIKDLAKYLLSVSSSEEKYINYLMNKDRFETDGVNPFCTICKKLNNLEENRRTYTDLVERIANDTCYSPSDLDLNLLEWEYLNDPYSMI